MGEGSRVPAPCNVPSSEWGAYHFHDVSAPLRQQLQALQGQVEELPVLSVCLLSLLAARTCNNLDSHRSVKKSAHMQKNQPCAYPPG